MASCTMPTDKARVVTYVDPSVKRVLDKIASAEMRSLSNLVEKVLTEFAEEYEAKHGQQQPEK